MMKHKKIIGVVFLSLISSLFIIGGVVEVNAAPSAGSSKTPTDCSSKNTNSLRNYYNISYKWSKDGKSLTFQSSKGEFRFITIDGKFFTNTFAKDSDGFYTIDGKKGVVSNSNKVKLTIRDSSRGNSVTVNLALSKNNGVCDSRQTFLKKKAANQESSTFETGNFEIVIPFSSTDQNRFKEDNSKNYNGVCRALREGKNYQNKINPEILKLYSGAGRTYYRNIAPSCWEQNSVYVYSEKQMISIIQTALSTWDAYNSGNAKVGDGAKDVNGDQWLLNFEEIKNNAVSAKNNYKTDGAGNFTSLSGKSAKGKAEAFSMKCKVSSSNFSDFLEHTTTKNEHGENYNINANKQYYYAYNEVSSNVTYKWYTAWNKKTNPKAQTISKKLCTRKCEEAVEVKYGPPVATKAGLCFEYQVQVTSRIKCSTTIDYKPPEPKNLCVPVPYCNDIPGYTHQAGGNDEFKACVKSCDGGKYTEKCSDKCYKKVYETTSDKKQTNNILENPQAKQIYSKKYSFNGYHYFNGSSIKWSNDTYANYYKYYELARTNKDHKTHGGSYVPESGFKKRLYSTGTCKDPCFFTGCSKTQYVNKSDYKRDYIENLKAYKTAINQCKASASCTTKTATFTISVDYTNGKGKTKTVNYPYSTEAEKLQTSSKANVCNTNSSTVKAATNIILGYKGCYANCPNGAGTQYHTRWSFPGSWLNKKTGELSFGKPSNTMGWTKSEQKFCLPLDMKDVNVKWWKYYYSHYNKTTTTSYTTGNSSAATSCENPASITSIADKDIEKWNIKASTRNFGYFGWNFDISCFYATNSSSTAATAGNDAEKCNPGGTNNSTKKTTSSGSSTSSYRIRTVDLKQLFPAGEGQSSSSSSGLGSGSREPGFNWSVNATTEKENGKNESAPSKYAQQVQSLGYKVYNDDNLDYRFVLTKEILSKLKADDRNYTAFDNGKMVTKNGMYSYRSNVIRNTSFGSGSVILSDGAIGCNNTKNNACDTSAHSKKEAE